MACAKPPNPDRITPPSPLGHPMVHPVLAALRDTEDRIRLNPPGVSADNSIRRTERLLQSAISSGISKADQERFEGRLHNLKNLAQSRMRDNVGGAAPMRRVGEKVASVGWVMNAFSEDSAKRNAPRVIRALENRDHWQSKEYRELLIRMIEGNARIPQEYREQLPHDVAKILRICPNGAGIVKAMTLRGQRTALASPGKLGSNANSAIGSAYELMGTAALIGKVSTPVNSGPKLIIDPAQDEIFFGNKSNINRQVDKLGLITMPTRKTIESDVMIQRSTLTSFREIGIDFKHGGEARPRYASEDLRNQVDNVVWALRCGQLDEYHFVTNSTFGSSFREVIDAANRELGHSAIGCHEYVTSNHPGLL
jgi:hypothetical protein